MIGQAKLDCLYILGIYGSWTEVGLREKDREKKEKKGLGFT